MGIFDFNHDGKTSFIEFAAGMRIVDDMIRSEKEEWRSEIGDGSEYGINAQDYDSKEDYEFAYNQAKYAWRESCPGLWETGVDPDLYDTKEDYLEALESSREFDNDSTDDEFGYRFDDGTGADEYADDIDMSDMFGEGYEEFKNLF